MRSAALSLPVIAGGSMRGPVMCGFLRAVMLGTISRAGRNAPGRIRAIGCASAAWAVLPGAASSPSQAPDPTLLTVAASKEERGINKERDAVAPSPGIQAR